MKRLLLSITMCFLFLAVDAQEESKWPPIDKSVLDAATYPRAAAWRNYMGEEDRNLAPRARVVYSRPKMNERKIFGELVPFGKEWRLGANEATMMTLYQDADIDGNILQRGTYSLHCTPMADKWDITFSSQIGIWGSENRDKSMDALTVTVPTQKVAKAREALTMTFQRVDDDNFNYVIEWENTRVVVPMGHNPVRLDGLDKSPMDKAVYPDKASYVNYLKGDEAKLTPKITVLYSRPFKKDRKIFGELLNVGDTWRVGANESTEITFAQEVSIKGKTLKAGKYVLYADLKEGSWDMIFSKDYPAWGNANRDESKDVLTVNIPLTSEKEDLENLSIIFDEKSPKLVHMVIGWETTRAELPFEMK